MTAEAELRSLAAHSQYFRWSRQQDLKLSEEEKQRVLQVAEELYAPARYQLREDFGTRSHFDEVLRRLDYTSSPGYPYNREASTIGGWLGWNGITYNEMRADRLWQDCQAFINGDMDTLYRVFVKDEPHKLSKAQQDRWRLIICPPLCEQVVWAMWFGQGNDVEIDTVGSTPSLQGIKLVEGCWKDYNRLFQQVGCDKAIDKSAWDWTAHIEWINLDFQLRCRLLTAEPGLKSRWMNVARMLYRRAFLHPRLLLSNGEVWEQLYPGVMKSGCVNTISTNSHCQVLAHIWLCLKNRLAVRPAPFAVGDDTIGKARNTPTPEQYARAGILVKPTGGGLEFVGHEFDPKFGKPPMPAYRAKHVFRYFQVDRDNLPSFLESMVRLYAHDDEFSSFWRIIAFRRKILLPSAEYCRFWYDNREE